MQVVELCAENTNDTRQQPHCLGTANQATTGDSCASEGAPNALMSFSRESSAVALTLAERVSVARWNGMKYLSASTSVLRSSDTTCNSHVAAMHTTDKPMHLRCTRSILFDCGCGATNNTHHSREGVRRTPPHGEPRPLLILPMTSSQEARRALSERELCERIRCTERNTNASMAARWQGKEQSTKRGRAAARPGLGDHGRRAGGARQRLTTIMRCSNGLTPSVRTKAHARVRM